MKTLLLAVLLALAAPAQASNTLFSAVDPQSAVKNPVVTGLGFEGRNVRGSVAIGTGDVLVGTMDVFVYTKSGFLFGVGAVADRLGDNDYTVSTSASVDSAVVVPHDHGKHKGDTHVRGGKVVTLNRSYASSMSLLGSEFGIAPSFFIGVCNPVGLFAESRVLFNGGELSNRVTVGVRW